MGFNPYFNGEKVSFYSKDFYLYLTQFGKCDKKYIPAEIKQSAPNQIKIFLNAFISCDGHIKKARSFVGNRGKICTPKEDERVYFTTSETMAGDIGELILKIGRRPSFKVDKTKGKQHDFKNGTYTINHDCIRISECRSRTATQYKKEIVQYSGLVYDLTLAKNNTMYIRRNGKCFWGSNCRCVMTPIIVSGNEATKLIDAQIAGEEYTPKQIESMPPQFNKWINDNRGRLNRANTRGTLPYWVKNNAKFAGISVNNFSELLFNMYKKFKNSGNIEIVVG